MGETEVQPSVADILRRRKVLRLLLRSHRVPDLVPLLVPPEVVQLCTGVYDRQVDAADYDERTITAPVPRSVVLAVDVGGDDRGGLDEHVVKRRIDRTRCDGAGVSGAPRNLDGMSVRVREKSRRQTLQTT